MSTLIARVPTWGWTALAAFAVLNVLFQAQVDSLLAANRAPRSFDEPVGADDGTLGTFGEVVRRSASREGVRAPARRHRGAGSRRPAR